MFGIQVRLTKEFIQGGVIYVFLGPKGKGNINNALIEKHAGKRVVLVCSIPNSNLACIYM